MSEWIAYARTNPFGEERADLRAAIIASSITNAIIASVGGERSDMTKIDDFMLNFEKQKKVEPMKPEIMWQILKGMARKA